MTISDNEHAGDHAPGRALVVQPSRADVLRARAVNLVTKSRAVMREHVYSIVSTIVGAGGFALSLWQYLAAPIKPDKLADFSATSAAIFGICGCVIVFILLRQSLLIQRAAYSLFEDNTNLKRQVDQLKIERDAKAAEAVAMAKLSGNVATQFHSLSVRFTEYETNLADFNSKLVNSALEAHNGSPPVLPVAVDHAWSALDSLFDSLLTNLCDTAVAVVRSKRRDGSAASANIKLLVPGDTPKSAPVFMPLRRSNGTPSRDKRDREQLERRTTIWENKFYATLIRKRLPLFVPDLDDYLHVMERAEDGWGYTEPNTAFLDLFKSCLLVPIEGCGDQDTDGRGFGDMSDNVAMDFGPGRHCIGFFCIDSPMKDFFEIDFDQDVMLQLANHTFALVRSHFAAKVSLGKFRQPS